MNSSEQPPDEAKASEGRAIFGALQASFDAAAERVGEHRYYYRIAEKVLLVRFAGDAMLEQCCKALAHVGCEPTDADFEICCFDDVSTTSRFPSEAFSSRTYREMAGPNGISIDGFDIFFQRCSNALSVVNVRGRRAIFNVDDAKLSGNAALSAGPFRFILNAWMLNEGLLPVHAAIVGTGQAAAMITGPSGAGKSSTALACVGSLRLLAEDLAVVDPRTLHAYSYFNSVKLLPREENLARFPELKSSFHEAASKSRESAGIEDKILLYLSEVRPEAVARDLPLKAVLVPDVQPIEHCRIEPLSRAQALLNLGPSSFLLGPRISEAAFKRLSRVVMQLPCYRIVVGRKPASIAEKIKNLLESL